MARTKNRLALFLAIVTAMLLLLGGCGSLGMGSGQDNQDNPGNEDRSPISDEYTVILYFADAQAQHVVPEQRRIEPGEGESLAAAAVRELLAGPEDPYLRSAFPDNARVTSVEVSDGVAYVNFAEGINIPGSTGETIAVRSLVYTLTDLDGVDKVQILVGGRSGASLGGHMVLDEPVERGPILDYPIFIDEQRVAWLQAEVDAGRQVWRRDPLAVVRFDGKMVGLTGKEDFVGVESNNPAIAVYSVTVDDITYRLELSKADPKDPGSIWLLTAVRRVE